ncbi:MAG: hypothetical protein KDG54_11245, partial [Geminicoccaceae bacterium]|nr:hypothetical protein [Geminicoccaceae bacterium]
RNAFLAWLAPSCFAGHAGLCDGRRDPPSCKRHATPKNAAKDQTDTTPALIRWSIQEIRRIANKMAQRQIQPAEIIAWSVWRRAHQAVARQCHVNSKLQL